MSEKDHRDIYLGPKKKTIPAEWDFETVERISNKVTDGTHSTPNYTEDGVPFLSTKNLKPFSDSFDFSDYVKYISEEDHKKLIKRAKPEQGDILISKSGTIGRTQKIRSNLEFSIFVGLALIKPKNEKVDTDYIEQFFNSDLMQAVLDIKSPGSTRKTLNVGTLKKQKVILPPLSEQGRIADILSTVDEQIQQTDEVIKTTEELKRGLMQNVFNIDTTADTPESGLLNNVQKESVGDFVEIISGVHVKSDHVTHDSSQTPYLTGPADFAHRGFSVTKYTNKTSKFCEPGDTLVTVKGSGCGNSTFATQRAGISRQLKALRPGDLLDEQYLYYYLQTKTKLLSILAQGTSIPGLSTSDLTTLTIPLPELDAQQQIGEIFATIDDQITEERERKQELKDLKRGLMQDLLTGKRRVDPERA